MRWGVGTGRCGTLSLATELGGVHEGSPGLGSDGPTLELLLGRLRAGVASVDRLQSFLMPEIRALDSNAEFIWLLRDPWSCIQSMLQTMHLGDLDLERATRYWLRVNRTIQKEARVEDTTVRLTGSLLEHEGQTEVFTRYTLSPEDHDRITLACGEAWLEFQDWPERR